MSRELVGERLSRRGAFVIMWVIERLKKMKIAAIVLAVLTAIVILVGSNLLTGYFCFIAGHQDGWRNRFRSPDWQNGYPIQTRHDAEDNFDENQIAAENYRKGFAAAFEILQPQNGQTMPVR